MVAIFKKTCIVLSVALLVLTACSGGGGGGGGQPADPSNPSTKEPTSDSKKEPSSDSKKEPTSDSKKEPTSDSKKEPTSDTPSYKLPDTGQVDGSTDTPGEDADYPGNPLSYTVDSTKKTVLDNNTELMWEQLPGFGDHVQRTHADASTHCGARTTGDYSDWRLPSIDELESIINFGKHSPAIDTTTFPNTKSSQYWTSRVDADNASNAWYVNFIEGFSGSGDRNTRYYVRCVRLSPTEPTTRFTDNGDETITDQKTKLVWQQLPDAADQTRINTWENALTHCEGLSFAGHSDWHLPNTKELLSITDRSRANPAIDPSTFPNTKSSLYWASTLNTRDTSKPWLVGFTTGNSIYGTRSNNGYVRCVRTPSMPRVPIYKLPDTGQTTSYTNTPGEDSDYTINTPSYTVDSSKKTVFDNNTELMWEQLPGSGDHAQRTHADAITYCGGRTTGGYSDWRLPSIDELESITNFGRTNPAVDPTIFPNTRAAYYWSSSSYAPRASFTWIANFENGLSFFDNRTNRFYVRCVRLSSTEPAKRFTDNGDETITDKKTKLVWQQLPDAADHNTTYTWEDALRYCEGLSFAGHYNWRLPNKKELLSIVDRSRSSGPAIDPTTFPNTKSGYYWSSTVDASITSNAGLVYFQSGQSTRWSQSSKFHVRCVRTPSVPSAPSYKLPDTGQTTGYTNTPGEDADYTINPPSYTVDSTKKTVFDNNTRLMWQQLPTSGEHVKKTHANAIAHCQAQTTGGYSDWHLPSIDELESITNFGRTNPTIDPTTFPNTKPLYYWASAINAGNRSFAWVVNFENGISFFDTSTNSNYVRCVRLSLADPAPRFINNGDETITDKKTGLMWQQLPDAVDHTTRTWEGALTRCEGLSFAGHDNWRLPNKKELLSIVDRSRSNPAIDPTAFPNTRSPYYWSSTVDMSNTSNAGVVYFQSGQSAHWSQSGNFYVRCVRSSR